MMYRTMVNSRRERRINNMIAKILLGVSILTMLVMISKDVLASTEIAVGPETATNVDATIAMIETSAADTVDEKINAIEASDPFEMDFNISYGDEPTISSSEKHYSEEDLEYLIMVLTGECQTLGFDEQILYGSVVLNRVESDEYPDSVKAVCLDKKYGVQYSSFWDGNAYRTPTETSKKAAQYLLDNGSQLPENVIYQAEFKQGSGVYMKSGNTYFCYK